MNTASLTDWSVEKYNADQSRLRSSHLKTILKPQGPRAYYLEHVCRVPVAEDDESTEVNELVIGNLFHDYILRGQVNWAACNHRRSTNKWHDFADENPGKVIVTPKHAKQMETWREAVMRNPKAREIIERGYPEITALMDYESEAGIPVPCKARFDLFDASNGDVYDLKTTRATDRNSFERQAEQLSYHVSAGFYDLHREALGIHSAGYSYIVVTKTDPSYCYVFPLSYTLMEHGRRMAETGINRVASCMSAMVTAKDPIDAWPDYIEMSQSDQMSPRVSTLERAGFLDGESNGWGQ